MRRFSVQGVWSWLTARLPSGDQWFHRHPQFGHPETIRQDHQLVFGLSRARIPTTRQLRYVGQVLSPGEQSWVRRLSTLAIIAALVLLGSFLNRHIALVPQTGGTLTEGLSGVPQYLNPALARLNTVDAELTTLTFRGLMIMNADFQLVPDLAERVDVSPDGKTYTITLKPNLRWSDGEPLTADDVTYTFELLSDPAYQSPYLQLFRAVKVERPDRRTVVFRLPEPLAPFLSYLTVGLLPEHAWVDSTPQSFALAELNLKPIGNGPFAFHSLAKDRAGNIKSYQLTRNKYFHGPAPYLDRMVIKFFPDYEAALEGLKMHAVDALGGIRLEDLDDVRRVGTIKPFGLSQLTAVFINQKTNGALKAKEARLALAYATDRSALVTDVLDGTGRPIVGPILPGYLGYNPYLKRYDFDLETANRILEDNGWKRTDGGIRQKGSQQLTFTFTVVDQPTLVAVANRLAKDWRQIGAQVEIKAVDINHIQKDVLRPRNYEALLFGQIFTTDPDPYPFWHSSQQKETGFNLSIFFNKKIDQDLEHARRTTSNDERATDYFDFQNVVAEEVPAIFLYQNLYLCVHSKNLRGIKADRIVSGTDRFLDISSWYLRTRPSWVTKKD